MFTPTKATCAVVVWIFIHVFVISLDYFNRLLLFDWKDVLKKCVRDKKMLWFLDILRKCWFCRHLELSSLTARKAGLMATQHTRQNKPGALPNMAWTSLLNLLMPERSKGNMRQSHKKYTFSHATNSFWFCRSISLHYIQSKLPLS